MENHFLLDTHIFVWAMESNKLLPESIKNKIANPNNKVFVSVASIWEIIIKRNLKKIKVDFDIETSIEKAGIEIIPIETSHALEIEKLPHHHKDPFDRMLVAQAIAENLIIITEDEKIKKYDVSTLS
jgi:PIN domain nuclease of toxin-antitoxin system